MPNDPLSRETTQPAIPVGQNVIAYPPPSAQRANGPAIVSLVCGILGCIPLLTSLVAVVFGIVGIRKARDPSFGGKSLAIVGLVLGIVGIIGWCSFGGFMATAYVASKPARAVAHQFALDLSNGNVPAAVANTGGMTTPQLTSVVQQMQPWGTLTDTTFTSFNTYWNINGTTTCNLSCTATFAKGGTKTYTVTVVKQGGTFKVQTFNFR